MQSYHLPRISAWHQFYELYICCYCSPTKWKNACLRVSRATVVICVVVVVMVVMIMLVMMVMKIMFTATVPWLSTQIIRPESCGLLWGLNSPSKQEAQFEQVRMIIFLGQPTNHHQINLPSQCSFLLIWAHPNAAGGLLHTSCQLIATVVTWAFKRRHRDAGRQGRLAWEILGHPAITAGVLTFLASNCLTVAKSEEIPTWSERLWTNHVQDVILMLMHIKLRSQIHPGHHTCNDLFCLKLALWNVSLPAVSIPHLDSSSPAKCTKLPGRPTMSRRPT